MLKFNFIVWTSVSQGITCISKIWFDMIILCVVHSHISNVLKHNWKIRNRIWVCDLCAQHSTMMYSYFVFSLELSLKNRHVTQGDAYPYAHTLLDTRSVFRDFFYYYVITFVAIWILLMKWHNKIRNKNKLIFVIWIRTCHLNLANEMA